jgi:hypothetical protein
MYDTRTAEEKESPNLRLIEIESPDETTEDEQPLTPEMVASLARLRLRLQEELFSPGISGRPQWFSLPVDI